MLFFFIGGFMKKILAIILCCIFALGTVQAQDIGEDVIRVYLRRLGIEQQIELKIDGEYIIQAENVELKPTQKLLVKIFIQNNLLYLYCNGITTKLGKEAWVYALQNDINSGLRINQSENLYHGTLHLSVIENKIFPVLHIPVEQYLLGVVPYEMSNSFPVDALKAQSIAARTYAIKHIQSKKNYDVEDTTNDQVYKGYNRRLNHAIQAVEETKAQIGFAGKDIATSFYSGSNGGQTELPENRWSQKLSTYKMVDDPFDLNNPNSMVKKIVLSKKSPAFDTASAQRTIAKSLQEHALAAGFDTDTQNIRIDEISFAKLENPLFAKPSKVMGTLHLKVKFSGKKVLPKDIANTIPIPAPSPTPFICTFIKITPPPVEYKNLSDYIAYEKTVDIKLNIFPDVIQGFGLALRGGGKEILNIIENKDSYTIEARRFGHGVGMSQRGAEQMAKEGKTYLDILKFYYPGMTIKNYTEQAITMPTAPKLTFDEGILQTPPPPVKKTQPKPYPLLWEIPAHIQVVKVSNIASDSFLNLRQSPDLDSGVVSRLYYGQELVVAEEIDDKWLHVFLNKETAEEYLEGYIVKEFVEAVK